MRLITDFDGVWTDPRREAEVIDAVAEEELARGARLSREEVRRRLDSVRSSVRAEPARHGWTIAGLITAYADEDPFCFQCGVYAALARSDAPELARLVQAMDELGGAGAFGAHCYERGIARAVAEHGPPILPGARALLDALVEAFEEVVVVSNSSPEKLERNFTHAGVHPGAGRYERVRLRGHARKFVLRPEPAPPGGIVEREFAGRAVRLDRGHYAEVLRDERPDVVVGDVFSLDLALPLAASEAGAPSPRIVPVLLANESTPAWTRAVAAAHPLLCVVSSLAELAHAVR